MEIQEILSRCANIKKERKPVFSNYYNKYNNSEADFDVLEEEGTIVFGLQEEFIYRVYFLSNNFSGLKKCLAKVRNDAVLDWVFKGEMDEIGEIIRECGWEEYAEYARNMVPVPNPQKKKTRITLMLEKMYDPQCGQLAAEEDIPAIRELMLDTFDPVNSEILSEEELRELIKEETVWLYKVEDQITTCYIFRIEGKKRYGAMTYNRLSMDYLYNITRRANEMSDIKHKPKWHYGWINIRNKKIIRSLKELGEFNLDGVRNMIYIKK